jgi:dihydroorotate dehydrogenase (NAD+) catalytic subunit
MLSSIGLQNQGLDYFLSAIFPQSQTACRPDQIIISVAGNSPEDYQTIVSRLAEQIKPGEIAAIQINTACPNVQHGGGAICQLPNALEALMKQLVKLSPFPVIGKINTNSSNFCEAARAVESSGADAICLTNTPIGMVIDTKTRRPALGNVKGPLAGPAIRPLGVARTWDVYRSVALPIITGGGVATTNDVLEYLMAGATAIDVGSANFVDPDAAVKLLDGLQAYLADNNIQSLAELIGAAQRT